MNSQQAREKLEALVENSTTGVDIMAAVDVLMLAVRLAVIDDILENGYSLEQIEDTRRNVIEGVE